MSKNRFQFRAEVNVSVSNCVVKRLYAEPVTYQDQSSRRFLPKCGSKHASKAPETIGVPLHKGPQGNFRVAVRLKLVPELFQFAAQLCVIINLSVEDDRAIAIFGPHRLIAAFQINNLEANGAHREVAGFENAVLIRASVMQFRNGAANHTRRWAVAEVSKTSNTAHSDCLRPLPPRYRYVQANTASGAD